MDKRKIYKDITCLMHVMGTPTHMKGHNYLRTAIYDAYFDQDLLHHMMRGLYTNVAKQYDTTASRVERDIRAVIEATWLRGDPKILFGIFKNTVSSTRGKPSNREFITMIVDYLLIR